MFSKVLCWEADKGGDTGGDPPKNDPPPKTFTQEEVNKIIAKDRRKLQDQNEQLAKQLESIKEQSNLTAQEKDDLAGQIENLRTQYMSDTEKAQREREKLTKTHESKLSETLKDRDTWKNKYSSVIIENALRKSATDGEALFPDQVVELLMSKTQLVEEVGQDGKPTGQLVPKVTFPTVDKDGQPITLTLTPVEAVKTMKDTPDRFGNLFKSHVTGGLGNNSSVKSPAIGDLRDIKNYKKWREENPERVLPIGK